MSNDRRVPDDVWAWAVAFDAWIDAQRGVDEPPDGLKSLKDALLEEILARRGVTPTRRPMPPPGRPGRAAPEPTLTRRRRPH